MKTILVLVSILSLAFAYDIITMTNGVTYSRTFEVDDFNTVFSDIQLYRMFIPTNVLQINFTSVTTNPATCEENSEVFVSGGRGLPCGIPDGAPETFGLTPCLNYDFLDFEFEGNIFLFGTGDSDQIADMQVGTWWFFALRKSTGVPDEVCSYDFVVTYTTCASDQVGIGSEFEDDFACIPAITGAPLNTWFETVQVNTTNSVVYQVSIPEEVNWLFVEVNTTDDGFFAIGQASVVNVLSSDCETDGNVDNQYTFTCFSIPAGNFFISLQTDNGDTNFKYLMRITTHTCSNTTSGVQCGSALIAFNSNNVYTRTLGTSVNQESADVYYIDVPVNSTSAWNITFNSISDSATGSVTYKKGAFAFDFADLTEQSGFLYETDTLEFFFDDPITLYLSNEDLYEGGRFYFTVTNLDSTDGDGLVLNYTVTVQEVIVTTTTAATTAATAAATTARTSATAATTTAAATTARTSATATATAATSTGSATSRTTGTTATTAHPTSAATTTSAAAATTGAAVTTGAASSIVAPFFFMAAVVLALLF